VTRTVLVSRDVLVPELIRPTLKVQKLRDMLTFPSSSGLSQVLLKAGQDPRWLCARHGYCHALLSGCRIDSYHITAMPCQEAPHAEP
jgi:hypothetical protein